MIFIQRSYLTKNKIIPYEELTFYSVLREDWKSYFVESQFDLRTNLYGKENTFKRHFLANALYIYINIAVQRILNSLNTCWIRALSIRFEKTVRMAVGNRLTKCFDVTELISGEGKNRRSELKLTVCRKSAICKRNATCKFNTIQ